MADKDVYQRLKKEDIKSICRVCLNNTKSLHSIFQLNCWIYQAQFFQFNLRQFLKDYVNLIFQEGDNLPHRICEACLSQTTAAYVFKQQCEKADRILQDFLKQNPSTGSKNRVDDNGMRQCENEATDTIGCVKETTDPSEDHENAKTVSTLVSNHNIHNVPNDFSHFKNGNGLSTQELLHHEDCSSDHDENEQSAAIANGDNINYDKVLPAPVKQYLRCGVCREVMPSFEELTTHRKIHGEKIFQCIVCDASFIHMKNLEKHRSVHKQGKARRGYYQCISCMEKFSDKNSLSGHNCFHKGTASFKCSYCDRKFTQRRPLENHEKTHTGERPHVCDICGKGYIQRNNMMIHRRTHTGEKPFICKECGKAFTSGASLTLHRPVHTGVKDFVCTICGKRIARRGELTIHMRTHTGEKPYACRTCSKTFIKKSSLQAHMYSHSGEKNYICPICGRRIAFAGKLTVHMRTHTNAKPFTCPVCQRGFANQSYLKKHSKIHIDTAGSGGRMFLCHCGQTFSKRSSLTDHMNTHTDSRPYECSVCHHGFAQMSTRNRHMRTAHADTCSGFSKVS